MNSLSKAANIAAFIFSFLSLFFLAPLFFRLPALLGIIVLPRTQFFWATLVLFCALGGFLTFPVLCLAASTPSVQPSDIMPPPHTQSIQASKIQPITQTSNIARQYALEIVKAAIQECRDRRLRGEFKTFAESAKCSNPKIIDAYQNAQYPYMDLINLIAAKRLEFAELEDHKLITEAKAQLQMAEFMKVIADKERQRNKNQ